MRKGIIILLALVLTCATVVSASALTGVVDGPLRLRNTPSNKGTVIGWLKDGDTVTITGNPSPQWYAVTGTAYQHNDYTGWCMTKSGYSMKAYIH